MKNSQRILAALAIFFVVFCAAQGDLQFTTRGATVTASIRAGDPSQMNVMVSLNILGDDYQDHYDRFQYDWGSLGKDARTNLNWIRGKAVFAENDEISNSLLSLNYYRFQTETNKDVFEPIEMAIRPPNDPDARNWSIYFRGKTTKTDGSIKLLLPPTCKIVDSQGTPINMIEFSAGEFEVRAPESALNIGIADNTISGQYNVLATSSQRGVSILSFQGNIPLSVPSDVANTPGATKDASGQVADFASLSYDIYQYVRGGTLFMYGLRARATGELKGTELSAYGSTEYWFFEDQAKMSAELEFGYRKGDAEWETLTTKAPDRGNSLARLGLMLELRPVTSFVNKNFNQGLQFFFRARGWADSYRDDGGDQAIRFRPFFDGEIYMNIGDQYRLILLRHEQGYLPPDLSRYVNRWYAGFGVRF